MVILQGSVRAENWRMGPSELRLLLNMSVCPYVNQADLRGILERRIDVGKT